MQVTVTLRPVACGTDVSIVQDGAFSGAGMWSRYFCRSGSPESSRMRASQ
jgi:hypothetical protein